MAKHVKIIAIVLMLTLLSASYASSSSSSSSSSSNSDNVVISDSENSDMWDGIEKYDPSRDCETEIARHEITCISSVIKKDLSGQLDVTAACTGKNVSNTVGIECGLISNASFGCTVVVTTVFIKKDGNSELNVSALDDLESFESLKKL